MAPANANTGEGFWLELTPLEELTESVYPLPLHEDGARLFRMPARRLAVFLSSCSQMRTTLHPSLRKNLFTLRSRALLPSSFFFQNARLFTGRFECFGQACQKQPSTKTAHLIAGKTKSGFPKTGRLRRQPVTRCFRNRLIKASSVSLFPLPRMRDMTCDRLVLVKTSAIVNWDAKNLMPLSHVPARWHYVLLCFATWLGGYINRFCCFIESTDAFRRSTELAAFLRQRLI